MITLYFETAILGMKFGEVCESWQEKKLESGLGVVVEFPSISF